MYFSCSTTVFRSCPVDEAIKEIAKAGFCAIELMADHPHAFPGDLDAARTASIIGCLESNRMKVNNLDSCRALAEWNKASWISENWQEREMRIRYTLDSMRVAAALGIPGVTIEVPGPIPVSMDAFDAWRIFVASMHRVLPLARKLGLKLLVQSAPESLIGASGKMLELVRELEEYEHLRVDFDAAYFFLAGEDPREAWDRLASHVGHVHISDIGEDRAGVRLQLGKGVMDIPGFLRHIESSGYGGFVTVRPDVSDGAAEDSARYLKSEGFMRRDGDCPE